MSTANAVTRETAWLLTYGDGLPALHAEQGGPFDVLQAYLTRTPGTEQRSLYVLRSTIRNVRFAAVRQMNKHRFTLRISWPANDGQGLVEDDQQALDDAVDLVLRRINGTYQDKTHGGRFLSVGEGGEDLTVTFTDPAHTLPDAGVLLAEITYTADDPEDIG